MPLGLFGSLKLNNVQIFGDLSFTMAPKALEILKKGLAKFPRKIKDQKDALNAKLTQKETISSTDECYDFKLLSDNRLYSCSVLGKLSIVNSRCSWF